MAMRLTPIGVGEAFDPLEPSSAALVEAEGFTLLIDCGHAAVLPLWRARPDPDSVDAIYLTHRHADHVLGLVPVLDRWGYQGRRRGLTILASAQVLEQLRGLLEVNGVPIDTRSAFPITLQIATETDHIGPFAVRVAPTQHAVPNHAIHLQSGGRRLAYSGDGRPTEAARALYADVHLLFQECFAPKAAEHLPFHCDLPTVRTIVGPERIGLYHVEAGLRDALRAQVAGDPRLFVPEAGVTIEV
ncbi:MAG: ribonuclease Z [Acidisphaera sp.]|nr:ribonuclease Z [Acidisphaera sp.]